MKILCAGNINLDMTFPVGRLPGPHEKMTVPDASVTCGGSAANTAWWLAGLGQEVVMAGAVGDDPPGRALIEDLASSGIDVLGVSVVGGSSGLAVIISRGDEKRMLRSPGANLRGEFKPGLLEGCRLLYLSGVNTPLLLSYGRTASDMEIHVFYGPGGNSEEELMDLASGVILNADELRFLTGLEDPGEGLLSLDREHAAVTMEGGGCLVSEGREVHEVPSPRLEPVDRTGGGDAFAAGFIDALLRGLSPAERGEAGNRLAREVILSPGARPRRKRD
jgi:sugar/nucleoside kinase (ribokinase family)